MGVSDTSQKNLMVGAVDRHVRGQGGQHRSKPDGRQRAEELKKENVASKTQTDVDWEIIFL